MTDIAAHWTSREDETMRKYLDENKMELDSVICNYCGKKLLVENGILKEGCLEVDATFGYFSRKDGQNHRFDLCEDCYEKMVARFRIPVDSSEVKELL